MSWQQVPATGRPGFPNDASTMVWMTPEQADPSTTREKCRKICLQSYNNNINNVMVSASSLYWEHLSVHHPGRRKTHHGRGGKISGKQRSRINQGIKRLKRAVASLGLVLPSAPMVSPYGLPFPYLFGPNLSQELSHLWRPTGCFGAPEPATHCGTSSVTQCGLAHTSIPSWWCHWKNDDYSK